MTVHVNGQPWQVPENTMLAGVLDQLDLPSSGVAVAVNGAVVSRASWAATPLTEGSSVEVLTAVQGG